jgi:hypothetical protein
VNEHTLTWALGSIVAMVAVIATALATRVQLLPEVIDISIIPTGSGVASLAFVSYGALRRFEPDRVGRLALGGTLAGGLGAAGALAVALMDDVL